MSIRIVFCLIFSLAFVAIGLAAPPPPPGGSPSCWPPPCIPIDGGITFLMAAGALYGGKKLYDKKQKKNSELQ
ncbi:MAG: hypothetical protein JST26_06220 [Bacteroidetes bacterium]|nr:hypothetical protein [Bacteroidota bacterium]